MRPNIINASGIEWYILPIRHPVYDYIAICAAMTVKFISVDSPLVDTIKNRFPHGGYEALDGKERIFVNEMTSDHNIVLKSFIIAHLFTLLDIHGWHRDRKDPKWQT